MPLWFSGYKRGYKTTDANLAKVHLCDRWPTIKHNKKLPGRLSKTAGQLYQKTLLFLGVVGTQVGRSVGCDFNSAPAVNSQAIQKLFFFCPVDFARIQVIYLFEYWF